MAGLMSFSARNGLRSASSPRQWKRIHLTSRFFSSLTGMVHTSQRKSTSVPSHTTSIFSVSLPTQPIGYNLLMSVFLDLLQPQWHVDVIKFSRTLGPKFLYKTLSKSTCWLVMKLSRPKPSRRLLKTVGSGHSIPTSSQRQTTHQVESHQLRPTLPQLIHRQYLDISHMHPFGPFLAMTMTSLMTIPVTGRIQMTKGMVTVIVMLTAMARARAMAMTMTTVKAMMVKVAWMKTTWRRRIRSWSTTQMTNHHAAAARTITRLRLHYLIPLHTLNYLLSWLEIFTGNDETKNGSSWIPNLLNPFSFPRL